MNREVAKRVDRIAFLARLDDEFFGKFPVGEPRQAQHARRIRGRKVAVKLICETVQQRLGLILTGIPAFYFFRKLNAKNRLHGVGEDSPARAI